MKNSQWEEDIERCIGRSALITLENRYGRSYLYIRAGRPDKELVRLIGRIKAQALSDEFGGGDIYVPALMLKRIRNHQIREESAAGKTVHELAAKFKMTKIWVVKILQENHGFGEYPPK